MKAWSVITVMRCRFAALALVTSACAGCAPGEAPAPRPNVLLISIDTLRRDHLGCYGYRRPTSPTIDQLARRGGVFDNLISTSSWTLPSHVSLLTGRYPALHGVQDDGVTLSSEIATLAQLLAAKGYDTLAVVSHVYVSSQFGLGRGFERFDDSLINGGKQNPVAEQVVTRALALLDARHREPFFAFVHFFDPHWSYQPPAPFDRKFTDPGYSGPIDGSYRSMGRFLGPGVRIPPADLQQLIAHYDGEIAYVDAQLGRLLEWLEDRDLINNTVVILTGDHGEEFKEHGRLGHGRTLFGEQLRVPLVIAGSPAFPPNSRRSDLASLVDLAPTLLDLAGVEAPPALDGRSLARPEPHRQPAVFAESIRFGSELRAAIQGRYKLLHTLEGDQRVFFDLERDPLEQTPLREDPTGGTLSSALAEFAARGDRGWHIKIIASRGDRLRVRTTIETPGRIVRPRRYFSGRIMGSHADFATFELLDERSFSFDVEVSSHVGEVVFDTEPADAPVTFRIAALNTSGTAGVYLGAGEPVANGNGVTLRRSDPRVAGSPRNYRSANSGVYIRAVRAPSESAPQAELSEEALEHLKSLGYVD